MAGKSWKLEDPTARLSQGFIVTGYGGLKYGRALFLALPAACNGNWLAALTAEFPVTPAISVGGGAHEKQAISIAFTWSGLSRMGLSESALASFSSPFKEGMFEDNRMRRLGDKRGEEWQDTVIEGGPRWSGHTPSQREQETVGAYSVQSKTSDVSEKVAKKIPLAVHAMVLIYTDSATAVDTSVTQIQALLSPHNVEIAHMLPLQMDDHGDRAGREHFGFADGISQPKPFDPDGTITFDGKAVTQGDALNGTPLGEFVIGYENGHQEVAPGPVVPGELTGDAGNRPDEAGLEPHHNARGFYDIGKNGSYLVVRELRQDVAAFWRSMTEAAEIIRTRDPKAQHVTAEWLAEKIVGRTKEGHVLRENGPLKAGADGKPDNNFRFFDDDRSGYGCPLGSHVRRANPRDSLAPAENMKETLLNAANNHRILRRGRNYGQKLEDPSTDDKQDRGLLFMCLNTDIARQFEFIQQTWLLNADFSTLFEEVDPLLGADGWMTVPENPLRRRVQVKTFVQLAGGEYFFMPSLPALKYFAQL